jgi:FKBP-type peptidyl-prolyl cis-trans isomerase FkpA
MMKKIGINSWWTLAVLAVVAMTVSFAACKKETNTCTSFDAAAEDAAIQAFMKAKGIKGTKYSKGLYYEVVYQGSSVGPKQSSVIFCTYKGTLLNDSTFDEQSIPGRTGFQLNGLIEGWKLGLPLIGKGGTIRLMVPSNLGYGCSGSGTKIPPNSPLYFEITLVDYFN